ncbi:MAG: hypothetical protein E6J45_09625 [Chloroflexi bacterium]|nr:MAG: hypothetical protein E6J45_09625 [Chloroflexota bacterium]
MHRRLRAIMGAFALTVTALMPSLAQGTVPARALGAAAETPYFVQHVADSRAVGVTSLVAPLLATIDAGLPVPTDVASGDALVVTVLSTGSTVTSVTDSAGNAYDIEAQDSSAGALQTAIAISIDLQSSLNSDRGDGITVFTAGAAELMISVDEYAAVEAVDGAGAHHNALSISDSMSIAAATSPEIVVGAIGVLAPDNSPSWGGASWSESDFVTDDVSSLTSLFEDSAPGGGVTLSASVGRAAEWSLAEVGLFAFGEDLPLAAASLSSDPCNHSGSPQNITKVVLIIYENHSAAQILRNSKAPNINTLASECGLADRYVAATHPSLPNYLALIAGKPPTVGDCQPLDPAQNGASSPYPHGHCAGVPFPPPSLFGHVIDDGQSEKSWIGNMKDDGTEGNLNGTLANCLPENSDYDNAPTAPNPSDYHTAGSGSSAKDVTWHVYADHHNPQLYFTDVGITGSGSPITASATGACNSNDFALERIEGAGVCPVLDSNTGTCGDPHALDFFASTTLPTFSVIVPDNQSNMHDGSVGGGDKYLGQLLDQLTSNTKYTDGHTLILLTFDEGQKINCPNDANHPCSNNKPGKAVVPTDGPCYDPDSNMTGNKAINAPEYAGLNPSGPALPTAGVYTNSSLLPQSCMVPLIVMNYYLPSASSGGNADQGKYGVCTTGPSGIYTCPPPSGWSGPDASFLNHYDTLYSILKLLNKGTCETAGHPGACYAAIDSSGGANEVDKWTTTDTAHGTAHSPTSWAGYFGLRCSTYPTC